MDTSKSLLDQQKSAAFREELAVMVSLWAMLAGICVVLANAWAMSA